MAAMTFTPNASWGSLRCFKGGARRRSKVRGSYPRRHIISSDLIGKVCSYITRYVLILRLSRMLQDTFGGAPISQRFDLYMR